MMIHSKLPCHVNVSPSFSHLLLELHQVQASDVRRWQWKRQVADDRSCLELFEECVFQGIPRQGSSNSSQPEPQINGHDAHRSEEGYYDEPMTQIPAQAVRLVSLDSFSCWPKAIINCCNRQKDRIKINARVFGKL